MHGENKQGEVAGAWVSTLTLNEAVAQVSASIRFCRASLRGLDRGSWLPVMTMGFLKPAGRSAVSADGNSTVSKAQKGTRRRQAAD